VNSVPRNHRSDDDEWREIEAAITVAYAALTDAQVAHDRLVPQPHWGAGRGLDLSQALAIVLTILDAYLDAPEPES
jgi:hypothetical protein